MNILNELTGYSANNNAVKYMSNGFLKNYFHDFEWANIFSNITSKIITLVLITILFFLIATIGKKLIHYYFTKHIKKIKNPNVPNLTDKSSQTLAKRNKTMYTLTENAYYYLVVFFWLYSILSIIGIPVGTLIAGAGIFSLAIGLGAQGFVSDIVSGFFILFEHQMDVGEHVIINNVNGIVSAVGLRTTEIRSANGTLNYIPNRDITTVANLSRGNIQAVINLRITPEAPIRDIEKIIGEVNKAKGTNPDIVGTPLIMGTVYLPDGSLAIQVQITCKSGTESTIQSEYLAAYLEALQKEDIKLPLSPQTVVLPPNA